MSKREVEEEGFVKWFSELSSKDVNVAGGKGASLAEMYNNNFPIPPGFMVTAQAYAYFVEKAGLVNDIKEIIDKIDVNDTRGLEEAAKEIREIITSAELPEELREVIKEAYEVLDVDKKSLGRARGSAVCCGEKLGYC
jgi:pyruvate, water dikinase